MTKLTFQEAKAMLDLGIPSADVREENEYITGHVENSVNLPLSLLIDVPEPEGRAFAEEMFPNKSAPLMVYCRSGRRSILAAAALENFGYTDVMDMGGLSDWPYGLTTD